MPCMAPRREGYNGSALLPNIMPASAGILEARRRLDFGGRLLSLRAVNFSIAPSWFDAGDRCHAAGLFSGSL